MTLLTFLCQLISTTTFILMCHLILSKRLPRKITYSLYLYTIFICIFLAPFSGQYGIPIFLLGAIIILSFHKKDRLYNLLFFQILWAWSVLTDYAVTIPLRIAGYDFDVILTSLPLTLLFSILHALLCILPCLFIGNRLHRKLVTNQNVIPPRISGGHNLFLYFPDQHHFRQSASLSERYSVLQRNPDFLLRNSKCPDFSDALQHTAGQQKAGASGP